MNAGSAQPKSSAVYLGRTFVHPIFDYALIGGGISLLFTAVLVMFRSEMQISPDWAALPVIILLSNSAHFAASSIRLYTKPGSFQSLPVLTMVFPLVALVILSLSIMFAGTLGPHLQALYLTWSPFHYAAQAYGLSVMYCYRSGCPLTISGKRLLWWVGMLPFLYTFLVGKVTGLGWLLPASVQDLAVVESVRVVCGNVLPSLAFVGIVYLVIKVWRSESGPMPLISILVLLSNGIWWFVLSPLSAFVWATVFHGLQYLAIVVIFHVKDQMAMPENRNSVTYHVLWFYGACVLLGYALFQCLPWGFEYAGFGLLESKLLVVAAINIHHFIVDAYIWRLNKSDSNRRVVDDVQLVPASAAT